jgi:hypothetical protein
MLNLAYGDTSQLQAILDDYPSLEILWVNCYAFCQLAGWTGSCPSLRQVHVSFYAGGSSAIFEALFHAPAKSMVAMLLDRAMFPSLESVVVCGDSPETLGIEEATWEGWAHRLQEVNVSLKDYRDH